MATDYGSGLLMLDDMPDPEVMGSGELLVAYDIARRWLEPAGTHALIGDNAPYDSFDIREYLGARFGLNDRSVLDEIQQNCIATASQDPRVESLTVEATFSQGRNSVSAVIQGSAGPFTLVLTVAQGLAPLLVLNGVLVTR